jgi:hypothetical protein
MQAENEGQILPQMPGQKKIIPDKFSGLAADLDNLFRMTEKIADTLSGSLRRADPEAGIVKLITCRPMPPVSPPITGLPFHMASVTVSPKPSLMDFCRIMSAARCRALIFLCASGGRSRIWMSGSSSAASLTSLSTISPSGSSVAPPPASTSCWSGTNFFTILLGLDDPHWIFHISNADL